MGQYYMAVNVDKKEKIKPHDFDCFAKLMEFSYITDKLSGNGFTDTLHTLMQTTWEGDRVYLVGDYADFEKYKEVDDNWLPTLKSLKAKFGNLGAVDKEGYTKTLYGFADNYFKAANPFERLEREPLRYMYNSKTKEYIDLKNLPMQWQKDDGTVVSIDPLPLLICMGNDRGGGDYHEKNDGYCHVGKWVSTSQHIFFSDELFDGYKEFKPEFCKKY